MRPDGRPSGPGRPKGARVFFALWPDAPARAALAGFAAEAVAGQGGRAMAAETLHLTLAFLGEQPLERLAEIRAVAGAIVAEPFECRLDSIGLWRDKQILWAGCRQTHDNLAKLASNLAAALQQAGYAIDRRPFRPHLTLVRNFRGEVAGLPAFHEAAWQCDEFVLVQSELRPHGAGYRTLASWPLGRR